LVKKPSKSWVALPGRSNDLSGMLPKN